MLPIYCVSHATCQNFVVTNLRKYYPNPDSNPNSTWNIIDRFWNLDLSFTDEFMRSKYSVFHSAPRAPSCMLRFYLLPIDFKVTSITDRAAQLKINPLYTSLVFLMSKNFFFILHTMLCLTTSIVAGMTYNRLLT